jgi:IS30 family transposase
MNIPVASLGNSSQKRSIVQIFQMLISKKVEILLNNRPRKVLDFETPLEHLEKLSRNMLN